MSTLPREWREEPGFNPLLPRFYRRTDRFQTIEHAKALMSVRCVAYPLNGCPTSFPREDVLCGLHRKLLLQFLGTDKLLSHGHFQVLMQ